MAAAPPPFKASRVDLRFRRRAHDLASNQASAPKPLAVQRVEIVPEYTAQELNSPPAMAQGHRSHHRRVAQAAVSVVTINVEVVATVDPAGNLLAKATITQQGSAPTLAAAAGVAPVLPADPSLPILPLPTALRVPSVPAVPPFPTDLAVPSVPAFPWPSGVPQADAGASVTSLAPTPPLASAAAAPSMPAAPSSELTSVAPSAETSLPALSLTLLNSISLSSLSSTTTISDSSSDSSLATSSSSQSASSSTSTSLTNDGENGSGNPAALPPAATTSAGAGAYASNPPPSLPTPQVVGSIVGSLAGAALILAVVLLLLRRHKRRQKSVLRLTGDDRTDNDQQPIRQAPMRNSLVPSAFLHRFSGMSRSTFETSTSGGEKSFQRVSGRKLPSAFSDGMTSEQFSRAGGPLAETSFYQDDHGTYGGSGVGLGKEIGRDFDKEIGGAPHARGSGPMNFRPSPARTPIIRHPEDALSQPTNHSHLSPPGSPNPEFSRRGTLGRSLHSADGSRSSRFTENV